MAWPDALMWMVMWGVRLAIKRYKGCKLEFRKDINGLRAIAVLSVVVFHFSPNIAPGGFAGVDVFFVISGYLMTKIIFSRMEDKSFSLVQFYIARANRIIPALAFLCLMLSILGWFYLTPLEYKALGKHIVSSLGFLSNFIYWGESGYFDSSAHTKWLLHTWSLSVEWQFYVLYPVVLVLLRNYCALNKLRIIIVMAAVVGFSYSAFFTSAWPTASYFSLHTRAWEMMLGGIAFLYPLSLAPLNKRRLEIVGVILIVAAYGMISEENSWPGYWAIIPTMGAFFIIQAQNNNSFITGNAFFQKLGSSSYSVYLWHWPLVVAGHYFKLPSSWIFIGIPLSFFLGYFSFRFIESYRFSSKLAITQGSVGYQLVLFVMLLGGGIYLSNGAIIRYSNEINVAAGEASNKSKYECMVDKDDSKKLEPCYIGNKKNIVAIVVGDSHADALTTSIASIYSLETHGIIALTRVSCPFILNAKHKKTNDACFNENPQRMEFIKEKYPSTPVFVISRLTAYVYGQSNPDRIRGDNSPNLFFNKMYDKPNNELLGELQDNFENTICSLTSTNPVFITKPVPEMRRNIPQTFIRDYMATGRLMSDYSLDKKLYLTRNRPIIDIITSVAEKCGALTIDPSGVLCNDRVCISNINGRPIYYDGDHLSEYGNKLLRSLFHQALKAI